MRNTRQSSSSAEKHVPHRTCVACHKVRPKQELVHLVRLPNGKVEVDLCRKKAGRGAYLCPAIECWEEGLRGNRLEQMLRTNLTKDEKEQLARFAKELS